MMYFLEEYILHLQQYLLLSALVFLPNLGVRIKQTNAELVHQFFGKWVRVPNPRIYMSDF
jgi:hypothetical protein